MSQDQGPHTDDTRRAWKTPKLVQLDVATGTQGGPLVKAGVENAVYRAS